MIYLFGDSYVEEEDQEKCLEKWGFTHKTWQHLLSEEMKELHLNYGKNGEGPVTTMEKFQRIFEKGYDDNPKIVIVLSYPFRIPWLFDISEISSHLDGQVINSAGILIEFFHNDKNVLTEQQYFAIKSMYDCMWTELSFMNIKNICYLSHLSKVHKIPMIVFTVYNMKKNKINFPEYPQINAENFPLCLDQLNDDLFYYYPTPLYDHTEKDKILNKTTNIPDEGINHFSEPNHHILKNIICNHFMGTNYSEKFQQSVYDSSELNDENLSQRKTVDFIYD